MRVRARTVGDPVDQFEGTQGILVSAREDDDLVWTEELAVTGITCCCARAGAAMRQPCHR